MAFVQQIHHCRIQGRDCRTQSGGARCWPIQWRRQRILRSGHDNVQGSNCGRSPPGRLRNPVGAEQRAGYHLQRGTYRERDCLLPIEDALGRIEQLPLYLIHGKQLDAKGVYTVCRHAVRQLGVGLIVVDYLQLISSSGEENRQVAVTNISRTLKMTASELNVPLLALCQLKRPPEKEEKREPRLSDLRESGALEQDADAVLFIHRKDYFEKGEPPDVQTTDVIIAKQRQGPTGRIPLRFSLNTSSFEAWRDEGGLYE